MKYTIVLLVANQPDHRGMIFSRESLIATAKNADPGNYKTRIDGNEYRARRLYMDGDRLMCEFILKPGFTCQRQ